MKHFGFDRFAVVGQDRGGRVTHRMALDHADKVTKAVLIDIVPTYYLYTHVNIDFVQAYFHWFNYLRAAPGPGERAAGAARRAGGPRAIAGASRVPARERHGRRRARHVRGLSRRRVDRSAARRGRSRRQDPLPAARAVGRERRDGSALRRARDLARARAQRHGQGHARRPQHAGRRAGRGARGAPCVLANALEERTSRSR